MTRLQSLGSWGVFLLTLAVYWICVAPSASLWDCPEYITTAFRLEVGHPPGNPAWTLMASVAAHLAPSPRHAVLAINLTSGIFTALAALMLFQIISYALRHTVPDPLPARGGASVSPRVASRARQAVTAGGAFCGSLCFAWADSTLFSAVEAEVYALSVFFTALSIRLMLAWADARGRRRRRFLILCAYVIGLSIGVHELNLLAITAMTLIFAFSSRRQRLGWHVWGYVAVSFLIIATILFLLVPGTVRLAGLADLLTTRAFGWERNSGAIVSLIILFILLFSLPLTAARLRASAAWIDALWMLAFLMTGYAVYLLIPIRAHADPPMNQGDPSDPFALLSYLKRDQYGSRPLLYGATPESVPLRIETFDSLGHPHYDEPVRIPGRPLYAPALKDACVGNRFGFLDSADMACNRRAAGDARGYIKTGHVVKYAHTPELNMFFPRMTSSNAADIQAYTDWTGMTGSTMVEVRTSVALDSSGNPVGRLSDDGRRIMERRHRPTYMQQFNYMVGYQFYYMYLRYILWNFAGRQNDRPASGEIEHGNFITGIPPIDNAMLGDQDALPPELGADNRGRHRYLMLPLLLGLGGAVWLMTRGRCGRRISSVVLALFLMTGLAIVFYLNQDPREPRERDYSFLGSILAFSIWIGAGAGALLLGATRLWLSRAERRRAGLLPLAAAWLLVIGIPVWMLAQNLPSNNRTGRHDADAIACNMLESLEPDAILFVDGDNTTFPVWYAQEVLGVRRDVTVVNMAYLTTPWYVAQLTRPREASQPTLMAGTPADYLYGAFSLVVYTRGGGSADAVAELRRLFSSTPGNGTPRINADTLLIGRGADAFALPLRQAADGRSSLTQQQLAIIDLIASNAASPNPRPVYWQRNISDRNFAGMKPLTRLTLLTRRLYPAQTAADSLAALDEGYRASQRLVDGGATEPGFYADPYAGQMISYQRLSLLMLAGRLSGAGSHTRAAECARRALAMWPLDLWRATAFTIDGTKVNEARLAARVLRASGSALGDLRMISEADSIDAAEDCRRAQFRQWFSRLSPAQRKVVSPSTRALFKD